MDIDALARAAGPIQDAMKTEDGKRAEVRFTGRAGGGAVELTIDGLLVVSGVRIAPAAAAGADIGMLEDLVAAAVSDALRQYRARFGATSAEQAQKMMSGQGGLGSLLSGLFCRPQ